MFMQSVKNIWIYITRDGHTTRNILGEQHIITAKSFANPQYLLYSKSTKTRPVVGTNSKFSFSYTRKNGWCVSAPSIIFQLTYESYVSRFCRNLSTFPTTWSFRCGMGNGETECKKYKSIFKYQFYTSTVSGAAVVEIMIIDIFGSILC